ncbi:hypothetical protein BDV96DRAFT_571493 [Lophiotrema nucula]|uniref:Uncharacterized protein n=1 Tax=Lophiotrema nucula TaxID=690887 RepID=A0A6A5ZC20_9PLEO|nr:hypothetical protein BDV96DRAFT_571493 [Lophiotrema nucula]
MWTDNLSDHLRLDNGDRRVRLFWHTQWLQSYPNDEPHSHLPPGLAVETLQTLVLLFPDSEKDTRKFCREEGIIGRMHHWIGEENFLGNELLNLNHYKYWQNRLAYLKEAFDHSSSGTVKWLWRDKRNPDRWFNSWIAIAAVALIVFFGLVQSIEGAIQVYEAYHPTPSQT